MAAKERTLILCVDQDNDIGKKAQVATPVIGPEANRDAAASLAIADPEEADANAMFGAVKLLKELQQKYPDEEFQVATIAGDPRGGIEADRKMVQELKQALSAFPANGIVLVSDGFADELIKPILQSRVPITSVHHVIVKHSERIEETYAVLGRYLRMMVNDPYWSKITLGVPGVLLIIFGFLIASNQLQNAGLAVTFVLGAVFLLKGFGIYNRISGLRPSLPPPEMQLVLISRMVGAVVAIVGGYQGASSASILIPANSKPMWDLSYWAGVFPTILGEFLLKGIDMIILGVMVALVGEAVSYYLKKDERLGTALVSIIMAFWMRFIVTESAKILQKPEIPLTFTSPLVFYTLASVFTTIIAVFLTYKRYKRLPFT